MKCISEGSGNKDYINVRESFFGDFYTAHDNMQKNWKCSTGSHRGKIFIIRCEKVIVSCTKKAVERVKC